MHKPRPVAEPSLVLGPVQTNKSFGKWARVAHPNQEHFTSEIQRDPLGRDLDLMLQLRELERTLVCLIAR